VDGTTSVKVTGLDEDAVLLLVVLSFAWSLSFSASAASE